MKNIIIPHHETLKIYNQLKTVDDNQYGTPAYLTKSMINHRFGEFTESGRTKFTYQDVVDYLAVMKAERERKQVLASYGDPRYGVSREFIQARCGA